MTRIPGPGAQTETGRNLPRRRGKSTGTLKLERAILDIVAERSPITVRGVRYLCVRLGLSRHLRTTDDCANFLQQMEVA